MSARPSTWHIFLALLAGAIATGCIDVTPYPVFDAGGDASSDDGSSNDSTADDASGLGDGG